MSRTATLALAAGLAITTIANADSDWAAPISGNWGIPSNWSPADVPDTNLETATIAVGPGAYTVTIGTFSPALTTINGLELLHPDATLNIQGGKTLSINAASMNVEGTIRVDSNNSTADSFLRFDAGTVVSGSGTIILNRSIDAVIDSGPVPFVNDVRIEGAGRIRAALINTGVIETGTGGSLELINNNKTNNGIMRAASSGILTIDDIAITQNAAGRIEANSGTVQFPSGLHSVSGGAMSSTGGGLFRVMSSSNLTLSGTTLDATVNIEGAGDLFVDGDLLNEGTIVVDSNNSTADARLVFTADGTISGSGTIRLNRNTDAVFDTDPGVTVTVGANQSVVGGGRILATLVNNGLIHADSAGATIPLAGGDKTNNNTIRASNNGTIDLTNTTLSQSPSAMLIGDGGVLDFFAGTSSIDGGNIQTLGGGLMRTRSGTDLTLSNVVFGGSMNTEGNSTIHLATDLVNNGTITIDSNNSTADAVVTTAVPITISGSGQLVLNRANDAVMNTTGAGSITIVPTQSVVGAGVINAALTNNGLIDAPVSGAYLRLADQDKINNGLIRAQTGATIDPSGVFIAQGAGATMRADGGTFRYTGATPARILGGNLETLNGGVVQVQSSAVLKVDNLAFSGQMNLEGNSTLSVDSDFENNGTIIVDSNNSSADAVILATAVSGPAVSLNGTGTVKLNRSTDARIDSDPGVTLILTSGQTVEGAGVINAALVNNGIINANTTGTIALRTNDKVNNNIMQTTMGTLDLTSVAIDQSGGGTTAANGAGTVLVQPSATPAHITGGTLASSGTGIVQVNAGARLDLEDLDSNASINILGNGILGTTGSVFNNGLIIVNLNNSSADAIVEAAPASAILGTGEIRLNRGGLDSQLIAAGNALLGPNQTVTGLGAIVGMWNWRGAISPGLSVGTMSNTGTINMQPDASMNVELASTASFDRLVGSGVIDLDGALNISFSGYTPVKNDAFRIIEASSVTGHFATVNGPALPEGLVYGILYDPAFVEIRITCGPDLNLDGLLDFFDVQFFLQAFAAQDPIGDFNEDGLFDFFDVLAFLDAFSAGCP